MSDTETPVTPAFSADYWAKAPRKLMPPAGVLAVQTLPNGDKAITLDIGARIVRPAGQIKQLILPGTKVAVEIIRTGGGEIVTGLFLPEIKAWAFQMTAQDLADYAKEVNEAVTEQRIKTRVAMVSHLKCAIIETLKPYEHIYQAMADDAFDRLAEDLAIHVVISLEEGPA